MKYFEPTKLEEHVARAREQWPEVLKDCVTAEDVGRALVMTYPAGAPHWTGNLILRALGILVGSTATRPNQ